MECRDVLESFDEENVDLSLSFRLRRRLHLFFCPSCAFEAEKYSVAFRLMAKNFMPEAPDIANNVMSALNLEGAGQLEEAGQIERDFYEKNADFMPWVVVGFILILSLAGSFFGIGFNIVLGSNGASFIVPFSVIAGSIITAYSALFIGTHLDALSRIFGLGKS